MNNAEALAFAERVLDLAWADLPPRHRELLEAIGAEGWDATGRPLGTYADELLRSAGYRGLDLPSRIGRDRARGLWIPELRVVLVNAVHPDYQGLDGPSCENALARVAWHEWGHALSLHGATREDLAAPSKIQRLSSEGIAVSEIEEVASSARSRRSGIWRFPMTSSRASTTSRNGRVRRSPVASAFGGQAGDSLFL
jgi:hypothetical protein